MALVFQEGQALGQGIQQAGTALGQALQQANQQRHQTALQRSLQEQKFQDELSLLAAKEGIRQTSYHSLLDKIGGRGAGAGAGVGGEEDILSGSLTRTPEGTTATLQEKVASLPSEDSPDPRQFSSDPSQLQIETPRGLVSKTEIDALIAHPDQNIREYGKSLNQQWMEKYKLTEKARTAKENTLLRINEPELVKVNDDLHNVELAGMAYERMQELIDTEGHTFPSAVTSAFFDLEGEGGLSDLGRSQLSAGAQEYIKLIVNQLKDAKGTFGARLTNLDVKTFLKGMPGLVNTPEGRKRIITQLRTVNESNQLYKQTILDEFEKAGGSDQISFSTAQARAKKSTAKQMAFLKSRFKNPDQNFSTLPSASIYANKKFRDNTTGEIFISDGKTWEKVE